MARLGNNNRTKNRTNYRQATYRQGANKEVYDFFTGRNAPVKKIIHLISLRQGTWTRTAATADPPYGSEDPASHASDTARIRLRSRPCRNW